uniref:CBM21 domain-containing protein n=1 Tax=Mola mola TaxID=94237 RepID=A0A3Q4BPU0_MOLML
VDVGLSVCLCLCLYHPVSVSWKMNYKVSHKKQIINRNHVPLREPSCSRCHLSSLYMRMHLELSTRKRVSFADMTGADLVDVKEFTAYGSDEEEGSARWEEEEAKYRRPLREPTYRVHAEFNAPAGGALLQAVRAHKVEVEHISTVENEPLAFSGLIRVLNISFHKAVYVRSTMDSWATYFDQPAGYVQGSNDGDTDRFSFKLTFAPPYISHGSRIEFVVRYETSEGDYWANNSSLNYAVTLLLSYEEDSDQKTTNKKPKHNYMLKNIYFAGTADWIQLTLGHLYSSILGY